MNLRELRQSRHDLASKGNTIVAQIRDIEAMEDPSADDEKRHTDLTASVQDIERRVRRLDEQIQREEANADRQALFTVGNDAGGDAGDSAAAGFEQLPTGAGAAPVLRQLFPNAFPSMPLDLGAVHPSLTDGFTSLSEFASCVRYACQPGAGSIDPRLVKPASLQAQADPLAHREQGSEDGYMVPPIMRAQIWEIIFEEGTILSRFFIEPTGGPSVQVLRDESTPWDALGVQAYWVAELAKIPRSRLHTEGSSMGLHKMAALVEASDELLEDAPRLQSRLTRRAGQAIRWKMEDSFVYGNGVGKPLGFFNSAVFIVVPKEGSQAANTIVTQNIFKMYARLLMQPNARPFWMANSNTVPQLGELQIGNNAAWTQMNAGMREAPAGVMIGYPLIFTEHSQTLGALGDLMLLDPEGYYAAQRNRDIRFSTSIHLLFDYDAEVFKWTIRIGGQPFASKPMTPPHSTDTKSHFVGLAERA